MRGTQATQIHPTNVKNGISIIWSDWFLEDHEFVEIWQSILEKMSIVQMIKSVVGQLCIIEHLKQANIQIRNVEMDKYRQMSKCGMCKYASKKM